MYVIISCLKRLVGKRDWEFNAQTFSELVLILSGIKTEMDQNSRSILFVSVDT